MEQILITKKVEGIEVFIGFSGERYYVEFRKKAWNQGANLKTYLEPIVEARELWVLSELIVDYIIEVLADGEDCLLKDCIDQVVKFFRMVRDKDRFVARSYLVDDDTSELNIMDIFSKYPNDRSLESKVKKINSIEM